MKVMHFSKKAQPYLLVIVSIICIGGFLNPFLGDRFLFEYSSTYWKLMGWVVILLTLIFAIMWCRDGQFQQILKSSYPTKWVRWLLLPLMPIASSILVAIAPLGWFALYAWLVSSPSINITGKVISITEYSQISKVCHQSAELAVNHLLGQVCLDKVLIGQTPRTGDNVTIFARPSRLGLFIDKIDSN